MASVLEAGGSRYFYPRSPCGERRGPRWTKCRHPRISIHALLAESDRFTPHFRADGIHFYPRSPCGERLWYHSLFAMQILISIHALLAESDTVTARIIDPTYDFYPRSPCGERLGSVAVVSRTWNFYPRSPCGERQEKQGHPGSGMIDFYPRSPCGERRAYGGTGAQISPISIHALLAESDSKSAQNSGALLRI